MGQQSTGMASRQPPILHLDPNVGRQVQQPHGVGHVAARLADCLAKLLLREAKLLHQTSKTFAFFDGVEILALEVFDQGSSHGICIGQVAHKHWDFMQTSLLRGAPAPFASNDFELLG